VVKLASRLRRPLLVVGTGALFLLAAFGSHLAALQASRVEALWPSNALVLAILILAGRNRQDVIAIIGGEVAGSVLLHLLRADPVAITSLLTIGNVTDSLLTFLFLRRMGVGRSLVDRVDTFFAFALACAAAGIFSASIGALGLWVGRGMPYWDAWRGWYVSDILGALVVAPTVVVAADVARGRAARDLSGRSLVEVIGVLGLVAVVTSFVFMRTGLPLTFVVSPCVLLATFRFRAVGAVSAISIVAAIAAWATAAGLGPIAHLLPQAGSQVLMLQLFIATTLLSALPVAAILTERDCRADETRAFADHFKSVVENIGEVIFRIDAQARWAYLNPAWQTLTGKSIQASLGRSWLDLVEPSERAELADRTAAVLRGEDPSTRRVVRLKTPGGLRWVELFVQGLHDPDGRVAGATGTLRDIDDRKRLEEHVITAKRRAEQRARDATLLASTDELTGISNRRAFMGQLDREIAGAAEFGWPLAVAMFDVDHFKTINDRYGHAVGDRVLKVIAARAAAVVRGGDMVGRLGGEEFGILMPGATLQEASIVAERLRHAMEASGDLDDSLPGVTVSVGIATREGHANAAELLAAADLALYAAKDEGRNRVRVAA